MPLSKRNRRNLIILLLVLAGVVLAPRIISNLSPSPKPVISFQEFEKHAVEIEANRKKKKQFKNSKKQKYKRLSQSVDPNDLTKKDWMNIGLSEKQTDIVLRFSERGLRSNEDLKKIFVFPEELFGLIKDSLFYPKSDKDHWVKADWENEKTEVKVIMVDINTADSITLKTIPGIGPFYAGKIVEHRNDLGGYLSFNQLTEIWKFDEEKLSNIREYSFLSGVKLSKLNINSATIEELVKHPYVNYKIANSIVKMRAANGKYDEIRAVLKSKLITREIYNKLEPYLTVE